MCTWRYDTHTHTQFWRTRKTCKIVAHSKILYYFIFQKISRRNKSKIFIVLFSSRTFFYTPAPRRGRGYTVLPLSVLPSVQDIFRRIFLRNCWWQKSDILSQASYRYTILWEAFLDPSDSYFLFADFVDFYTHWTYILYMPIFSRIFLSNYWWQKSDIWSQASYRYHISWEAFFDPSDSYFLFAEEWGYLKWALAHSSSCFF